MSEPAIANSAHALDRAAWARPNRTSIVYGDRRWTVAEAAFDSRRLAQLLAQAGVTRGDRVMLIAPNSPYHLLTHVACARLGAIFVPIAHRRSREELQDRVDFCTPRVVVCGPETAAGGAFASSGTVTHFLIDDDPAAGPLASGLARGYFGLSAGMSGLDGAFVADCEPEGPVSLNGHGYPSGTAAIFHTSGTFSGRARAVELTHENLWWGGLNFRDGLGYGNDDRVVVSAPLWHISGFNVVTLDLFTGGGRVVILRTFDPGGAIRAVEDHAATVMFGDPSMYSAILDHPDVAGHDLTSWRLPIVGGSPIPSVLLARLEIAGLRAVSVWGMTETAGSGTYLPFGAGRPGSVGRPFAHVQARIVDPLTLEDVSMGELLVRGPSVSRGYWHGGEYDRRAFLEGWLRTGDLASMQLGVVTILGRVGENGGLGRP